MTTWRDEGLCSPATAHLFFVNPAGGRRGETPPQTRAREAEARALCAKCPVKIKCRDEGRRLRAHGIWGGETEQERAGLGRAPEITDTRSVRAAARVARAAGGSRDEIAGSFGVSRRTLHRWLADETG